MMNYFDKLLSDAIHAHRQRLVPEDCNVMVHFFSPAAKVTILAMVNPSEARYEENLRLFQMLQRCYDPILK